MDRKLPLTFPQFKKIYSQVTRLCVDLVIRNSNGVILTLRQKNGYLNQWHFPGSTVYYREKITDTVHRTAKEELGIKVKIIKQLGYIEYFREVEERGFGYTYAVVFLCSPLSTTFTLDSDASQAKFFKKIPPNTIKEHKNFLKNLK